MVAAPFDTEDTDYTLADFVLPNSLEGFKENAGEIFIYHSVDDAVVPFGALEKYQSRLPGSHARIFKNKGHFMQEKFPELLDEIRRIEG